MMLATTMNSAAKQHHADDDRPVLIGDRLHRQGADALQAIDLFDDDGAAQQQRDIGAELGDQRGEGGAHAVLPTTFALAAPLARAVRM